jgi:hypothetical protein
MKKLFIGGLPGSGKGTLELLLDGHPNVFSVLIQALGISMFRKEFTDFLNRELLTIEWQRLRYDADDLISIRLQSDQTVCVSAAEIIGYLYRFENSLMNLCAASIKGLFKDTAIQNEERTRFEFDFFDFQKIFLGQITKKKIFNSIEELVDVFYGCYIASRKQSLEYDRNNFTLLVTLSTSIEEAKNALQICQTSKLVICHRNPVGLTYGNARRMFEKHYGSAADWVTSIEFYQHLYSPMFRKRYFEFHQAINELAKKTGRVLIVDFDEMILDTSSVVTKLCEFMGIEDRPILHVPSVSGVVLDQSSGGYLGKIADDPYSSLQDKTVRKLKKIYEIEKTEMFDYEYISWKIWAMLLFFRRKIFK